MINKDFVGSVATIVTVASFFAGVPVCLKVIRKGTTGDLSPTPFIVGNLCNALWLRYGLYISDSILTFVNSVGFVLQMLYVICFYFYTSNKTSFYRQILLYTLALTSMTVFLLFIASDIQKATDACGFMAAGCSIAFSAAPLSVLAQVLKTRSTESLPFPVIISSFLVTALWFIYGILASDLIIQVPNAIGVTICGLQLCLFAVFPSKKTHVEVS